MYGRYLGLTAVMCLGLTTMAYAAELTTLAEKTSFQRTGRYEEVVALCQAFHRAWPRRAKCVEFGRTPEQRAMLALVVSEDGVLDAASARKKARPVMLMQGGIHAGEIDGKDAGFMAVRDLLENKVAAHALSKVTLVFVPVFNVDGHERFGRWNRPNQIGPEEMGWRVTAQNFNLNRDYVKADAPEMHAMLKLLNAWDPVLYADLHVTDGAEFEHDISINVAPTLAGDAKLMQAGKGLSDAIVERLTQQGSLPINFYPSFIRDDDPSSGIANNVSPARFSQQYWATRNRLGVLVETHSWKTYGARVRSTYNTIIAMVEQTSQQGTAWLAAAGSADQHDTALAGTQIVLAYQNNDHKKIIDFRGYEYRREPSAISGGVVTKYNNRRPEVWHVPLYDEIQPAITVTAPSGGYIVPAAYANLVAEKLSLHAVQFRTLVQPVVSMHVEAFRASKATLSPATFEGHTTLNAVGDWHAEDRSIPSGSLFVPIAQPHAQLLMTLLEPRSADSLLNWGFFNNAFERKEYMETYVADEVAKEMLSKDPKLKSEFERKLSQEPAFAADPNARLDFFYRRHSAFDERYNLYPIYRINHVLP